MQRTKDMQSFINEFQLETFENTNINCCVSCKKPAIDFKDDLSRKEYSISGFCQTCQDDLFNLVLDNEN